MGQELWGFDVPDNRRIGITVAIPRRVVGKPGTEKGVSMCEETHVVESRAPDRPCNSPRSNENRGHDGDPLVDKPVVGEISRKL